MPRKKILSLSSVILISYILSCNLSHCLALHQNPDAKEIIKSYDDLMRGETCQGKFTMKISTTSWQRELELLVITEGKDKTFIRILSPAKEEGTTTLRVKNEMWNYLPRVERTIKIPPSMMLQPWMGSDFSNDDLVKESSIVNNYDHKITGEKQIDGRTVYIIESVPKPAAGVVWEKRIFWIQKEGSIPIKEKFYGRNEKLIKTLFYSEAKTISDRIIPTRWEMVSEIKKGHSTVITVDAGVEYNKPVQQAVFSLQYLKSTPQ